MASLSLQDVEKLYDETVERVFRFFYYKFLQTELAEDLTAKTFTKVVEKVKNNEVIKNPEHFVFGVAKIIYLEQLREKYKLKTTDLEGVDAALAATEIDGFVENRERQQASEKSLEDIALPFIEKLPKKQREIVHLRLIEKATIPEICEQLSVTPRYVQTTQNRGFNKLKELIACTA